MTRPHHPVTFAWAWLGPWQCRRMADNSPGIGAGIVVTGAGDKRVRMLVAQQLGAEVDVEVWGRCRANCGRCGASATWSVKPAACSFDSSYGRQHVDDIVVAEDDADIVVFATVCTAVAGEEGRACEGLWHFCLDRPLDDRSVIDGSSGANVPYVNVFDRCHDDDDEAAPKAVPQTSSSSAAAHLRAGVRARPS